MWTYPSWEVNHATFLEGRAFGCRGENSATNRSGGQTDRETHTAGRLACTVRGGFRHLQHVRPNRGPHKRGPRYKYISNITPILPHSLTVCFRKAGLKLLVSCSCNSSVCSINTQYSMLCYVVVGTCGPPYYELSLTPSHACLSSTPSFFSSGLITWIPPDCLLLLLLSVFTF